MGSKLLGPVPLSNGNEKAAPPPEAARTRDHTPQNGACETGQIIISPVTQKANGRK